MYYQELPNAKNSAADIFILPISYEDTVSERHGTKDAPESILKTTDQLEYYEEDQKWSPLKHMKVSVQENIRNYEAIAASVAKLKLSQKQLLISLGGEHSITPQITKALALQGATIVFLDAHADLRVSYQGFEYSHATPAHHLLQQGHKMLMVGIRSIFESEAQRIQEDPNITLFSDRALQKKKNMKKLLKELSSLKGDVYLSIDMDAFNPAEVPSVGTPQPGGLTWFDALKILKKLFFNKNITIKGVDMVELIPEESNVSQMFAAKLLQKIISYWGISKGFDTKIQNGSQMELKTLL